MKRLLVIVGIVTLGLVFFFPSLPIAADKVELTYWGIQRDAKTTAHRQKFMDKFREEYPDIELEVSLFPFTDLLAKQVTAGVTGTLPDVFEVPLEIRQRAAAGHIIPMGEFISEAEKKEFLDGAIGDATYQGKLYGIPIWNVGARLFMINKDLFQKAGITKYPQTWEEYVATAKKLTDSEKGIYGGSFDGAGQNTYNNFFQYLAQAGGSILNKEWTKCTVNSPAGVKALQFWIDLIHKYKVVHPNTANLDMNENIALFAAGKIAMLDGFSRYETQIKQINPDINMGFMAMVGDKKRAAFGATWNLVISTNSKNKKEAFKLIKVLTSDERMLTAPSFMPTKKRLLVQGKWAELDPEIRKNMAYMQAFEVTTVLSEMIETVHNGVREALLLKSSPQEALDKTAKKIDAILARK
jgi:multiple sugar transport system substrate-binding protein